MRKTAMFLFLFSVLSASLFAQGVMNAVDAPLPTGKIQEAKNTVSTAKLVRCVIDNTALKKINELTIDHAKAISAQDSQKAQHILDELSSLKDDINIQRMKCANQGTQETAPSGSGGAGSVTGSAASTGSTAGQPAAAIGIPSSGGAQTGYYAIMPASTKIVVQEYDPCEESRNWKQKRSEYAEILNDEEKMKEAGIAREEVEEELAYIDSAVLRASHVCYGGAQTSAATAPPAEYDEPCAEIRSMVEKRKFYAGIQSDEEKIKEMGTTQQELEDTIAYLNKEIQRMNYLCSGSAQTEADAIDRRIALKEGYISQHLEYNGISNYWTSDPDKFAASPEGDGPLEYCKKWYPQIKGVRATGESYLEKWQPGDGTASGGEGVVYECLSYEYDYLGKIVWCGGSGEQYKEKYGSWRMDENASETGYSTPLAYCKKWNEKASYVSEDDDYPYWGMNQGEELLAADLNRGIHRGNCEIYKCYYVEGISGEETSSSASQSAATKVYACVGFYEARIGDYVKVMIDGKYKAIIEFISVQNTDGANAAIVNIYNEDWNIVKETAIAENNAFYYFIENKIVGIEVGKILEGRRKTAFMRVALKKNEGAQYIDSGECTTTDWKNKAQPETMSAGGELAALPSSAQTAFPVLEGVKPITPENASEVSNYYKEKMTNIIGHAESIEAQVAKLKELRDEIDGMMQKLVQKKERIKMSEMDMLVERIEVSPDALMVDNTQIRNIKDKIIETKIENTPVEVQTQAEKVFLNEGDVQVEAPQGVSITADGVQVGGNEVGISPKEAVEKVKGIVQNIKLAGENGQAIYRIESEEQAKLLGILPVKVSKRITMNAQTGNVEKEEKPFWAALAN